MGTGSNKTYRMQASAGTDNATLVIAAPCEVVGIQGFNAKASTIYLKLYDKLTAPASTDIPRKVLAIPASAAFVFDFNHGVIFSLGLGFRIVTGAADNDTTAILANDVLSLNLDLR